MAKKIYLVGGAVRDKLMGLTPKDNDYVVVGSTPEEMLAEGFQQVGADFPVFLHPETKEEYALARTEVSTGPGYLDFKVDFNPNTTIEEDLKRRDLTINAIAIDMETGALVDPYSGMDDIKKRVLKMVNPNAFEEDPVRVFRLARFKARFPAFEIDDATYGKAMDMYTLDVTPERVGIEFMKALQTVQPSKFFDTLGGMGHTHFFDEVFELIGVPQPLKWHAEGDAFTHTMMVLDAAARDNMPIEVLFGALVHDLGKGTTYADILPSHHGHEERGVPLVAKFVDRLKLGNEFKRIGQMVARYHTHVHNVYKLNPKTFVKVFDDIKSHVDDARWIAQVAFYDNAGKLPYSPYGDKHRAFEFFVNAANVSLSSGYEIDVIQKMSIDARKNNHHRLKVAAVVQSQKTWEAYYAEYM